MGIFDFWKKKPLEKNYLRIYANIGQVEYSEEFKEEIIEFFIDIANDLNECPKLKYDISGVGYGISKSSPFLGEKAFRNRINSKGYSKLTGITIRTDERDYSSHFSIVKWPNNLNWLHVDFCWGYFNDKNLEKAINILNKLSEIIEIDYAYAYSSDSSLSDSGEWRDSKGFFSISSKTPKTEILWNKNISKIKSGVIKKLYPINIFNESQSKNLVDVIIPQEEIELNDKNVVWKFKRDTLKELNSKLSNAILN